MNSKKHEDDLDLQLSGSFSLEDCSFLLNLKYIFNDVLPILYFKEFVGACMSQKIKFAVRTYYLFEILTPWEHCVMHWMFFQPHNGYRADTFMIYLVHLCLGELVITVNLFIIFKLFTRKNSQFQIYLAYFQWMF